jgi:hypothetical protein
MACGVCPRSPPFLTSGYCAMNCRIIVIVELRPAMSGEEKIALDLALVLLIIVLVWAGWQR